MKTSFLSVAVAVAVFFPASLLAQIEGLHLPASVGLGNSLGAFVVVLTLLIAFADYTRGARTSFTRPAGATGEARPARVSLLRRWANEERRLAA